MRYSERLNFTYDPELGSKRDAQVALRLYDAYIRRYTDKKKTPRFFEVDRNPGGTNVDPLWGTPRSARTLFSRELDIPAINEFATQSFRIWWNKITTRGDRFHLSNLSLQRADYFPIQGDQVYWNGYRMTIINVELPPNAYVGQTGVWTGLVVTSVLAPTGDAIPPADLSKIAPAELAGSNQPVLTTPWPTTS